MRRILVITDPEFSNDVVLNRIREVTKEDTVFRVEHYLAPTSAKDAGAFRDAIQEKRTWLNELVAPLVQDGFTIETAVHSHGKLYEAIIANALEFGADYIFKPLRHHTTLQRALYTSTDWNLVRFCPCPLLFVGGQAEVHGKPVLATLDLEAQDQPHQDLNEVVLSRSKALAELIGGDLHLGNAYSTVSFAANSTALDAANIEAVRGKRDESIKRGLAIAAENGLGSDNLHVVEGAPEAVVKNIAQSIDAGIIVLGTMARTGFSGLFVGNTAESVIESSNSDVFIVKQRDFVSPTQ